MSKVKGFRKLYLGILKKMKFLPPHKCVKYYYEYYTSQKYNDKNPIRFNEKIHWYKTHYHPAILNQLVDKYAVREYVKEKIGEQYLNACLGIYEDINDIDFDALPDQFVIKGVHGYGFNLIVSDKSKLNVRKAKLKLYKWKRRNQYYRGGLEWAYKDVKPRFLVDKFMAEAARGSLTDYKFYCFNGKPKFLEVHLDRREDHKSGFFDLDFKLLPFRDVDESMWIQSPITKPTNFDEMVHLAEVLADRFPFVRVDFYSINGKTIFGEMTFYPGDGRYEFIPDEYNYKLGEMFVLPKLPKGETEITEY
ncbi:glycosyltransferase [Bacteroides coprosuis DSM 18011]|uniref:Glycosyltransferase n=1 Tax=Bacteroides coprosuis DSM 18011 TaxID=679937 RepID=F3ZTY4_9BACE|nr:ATP-grasp fold amidoligase family protein [Bacteroides coprosuis]EGJ72368.1 glycosyltransferase [Bacteroides coprosuis DSM 18011]